MYTVTPLTQNMAMNSHVGYVYADNFYETLSPEKASHPLSLIFDIAARECPKLLLACSAKTVLP